MTVDKKEIQITLKDFEIDYFWNIIAFALDLDCKEHCMTESERKMAKRLYDQTDTHTKYYEED